MRPRFPGGNGFGCRCARSGRRLDRRAFGELARIDRGCSDAGCDGVDGLAGWLTSPLASRLHKLIAEKSASLTPSEADVLPCKTPTPGANAHSGIRSAGASGSLLASSAVMTVRLATGR